MKVFCEDCGNKHELGRKAIENGHRYFMCSYCMHWVKLPKDIRGKTDNRPKAYHEKMKRYKITHKPLAVGRAKSIC